MYHMLLELTLLHVPESLDVSYATRIDPESLDVSYAARIDLVTCA